MALAASPRETAARAEVVFSMVSDTGALDAIAHGPDGVLAGLRPGATWVEMSTVSPAVIRALAAEAAAAGATLLDAPVSGSVFTLEQGQLSIMVGGDAAALERVRPYLLAIGPTITHVGPIGLAVTMKIATNLGLAVQMLAFSEAVLLAEKAGIARERAVETLLKSVVASPMIKYRGPFVLGMPAEAWFNVPMIQKDLELALELGRQNGVPLPSTALTQSFMTAARALGLGELDFAVVFDVLARLSGLPSSRRA
jgi:3-hydroxyisobutyrate dehydrogenase-like beta-hydroxyacid dehydrogenase